MSLNEHVRFDNERIVLAAKADSWADLQERAAQRKLAEAEAQGEEETQWEETHEGEEAVEEGEAVEEEAAAEEEEAPAEEAEEEAAEGEEEEGVEYEEAAEVEEEDRPVVHESRRLLDFILNDIQLYQALEDTVKLDLSNEFQKLGSPAKKFDLTKHTFSVSMPSVIEEVQDLILWGLAHKQPVGKFS